MRFNFDLIYHWLFPKWDIYLKTIRIIYFCGDQKYLSNMNITCMFFMKHNVFFYRNASWNDLSRLTLNVNSVSPFIYINDMQWFTGTIMFSRHYDNLANEKEGGQEGHLRVIWKIFTRIFGSNNKFLIFIFELITPWKNCMRVKNLLVAVY